ncbi:Nif3-like dinuclear metal center hexameric protein [Alteromonas lipolytica]|uniref:Uncharacterized protein n=1 Tax=Alteromonas lipolytica TaxID=1856405 RepID=A0A1E8FI76_9ALTE|nr:Nif3-like dinuclear metal center hexameric protein [Alteromonas lipolytica]OFI35609.1 hypothetical protein BFC17_12700 [Alteromonas lipolytica]GGF77559.1 hypothetical protein GCM10011338_32420 [Alteromonas lipolytica]
MLASQAIAALEHALGEPGQYTYEGLICGDTRAEITGIACCAQPSMAVLKQCVAQGCNLLIADGHPYYTYSPEWGAKNVREIVDDSEVGKAKTAYIEQHKLIIVRFTSAFDKRYPNAAAQALAKACGFTDLHTSADKPFVTSKIRQQSFDNLAKLVAVNTATRGMRVIAKPQLQVSTVAISTGMLSPAGIAAMLEDPAVDAVIGGEVVEWEGGPYFEDVIGSGRKAGLMLTGFASSREPIAQTLADWVSGELQGIAVTALHDPDPIHAV